MIYPDSFERKIGFEGIRPQLSKLCVTLPGAELTRTMEFSADFTIVERRLSLTAEMLDIVSNHEALPLDSVADIQAILNSIRVAGAGMSVDDLVKIKGFLMAVKAVSEYFASRRDNESLRSPWPGLDAIAVSLNTFPELRAAIDRTVDRYGNVKDNATPELADIRSRLRQISGTINSILRRVMARAVSEGLIDSDATPSVRDGRLVLPVLPANKRRINGIVHDESASGKTVFIEPAEVVEANNRVRELEIEERREIARIMAALAAMMRPEIEDMAACYADLGELDFIRAKALFAHTTGGCRPSLSAEPELEWYHACHPLLQMSLERQGKEIVPLDVTLSKANRILVISGPNAGGKSVCLKTVGTLQYMTQCGMLPPVHSNSHFGLFSDIFVDIGDDQSIEDDLSTYSSHLRSMKFFLQKGRESSLLLIDEFGGGTDPQMGGAIAQAILHRFNDKRMWGIITTHYPNLKHFAEDTAGLINGSMLYDRHLMQPMFRLSIGNPGSSFALEIARKTGLPADVIDEAGEIVGSDYVNLDKYLLDIARDKRYWENKRTAIHRREKELEATLERYRSEADTLRRSRREILDEARREASKIIEGSNAAIERTISDIRSAQAEKEQTRLARLKLADERRRIAETAPDESANRLLRKAPKEKKKRPAEPTPSAAKTPLVPGDIVKLDGSGTPGRILEINGKNAMVAFGMIKTSVKLDRLQRSNAKLDSGSSKKASFVSSATSDAMRQRQLSFKQDIDVRGMRVDEALQAVTYFIDDAIQFNAKRVRILHGTGTGALRQSLRQYLATIGGVVSAHDEDVRLGGAGITVVNLQE